LRLTTFIKANDDDDVQLSLNAQALLQQHYEL